MSLPEIRQFTTDDGYVHHYRYWNAVNSQPFGCVVALHGIQSHSGWYAYSSRMLAEANYTVCFLDRRGSGLNAQERGHAFNEHVLVDDVLQFLGHVRQTRVAAGHESPVVLMAVSWGGRLAAAVAGTCAKQIDAVALLCPGVFPAVDVPWSEKLRILFAALTGRQKRLVNIPLNDAALFTDQPEWQEFIRKDPLALRKVTIAFLLAHRRLTRRAVDSLDRLRCPVLVMMAGKDRIIDNAATRQWMEKMPPDQRTIIEYSNAQHTLEFDSHREQIVADLHDWLDLACRRN